jgi:hypothetical protein
MSSMGQLGYQTMARPRGRPKTDRDDTTVRLDRALASKARAISLHRGIPVGQYLSELLDQPINAGYLAMLRELDASSKPPKRGPKP